MKFKRTWLAGLLKLGTGAVAGYGLISLMEYLKIELLVGTILLVCSGGILVTLEVVSGFLDEMVHKGGASA